MCLAWWVGIQEGFAGGLEPTPGFWSYLFSSALVIKDHHPTIISIWKQHFPIGNWARSLCKVFHNQCPGIYHLT
jgi:hypothetical protein